MSWKTMDMNKKRWVILVACVMICVMQGTTSCWSVFKAGMLMNDAAFFSGMDTIPTQTQLQYGYTIYNCTIPLWTFVAGLVKMRIGANRTSFITGVITGVGLILVGTCVDNTMSLALIYGLICGTGFAAMYGLVQTIPPTYFPERRGLIAGIMMAANPVGVLFLSPFIDSLITSNGVSSAFVTMGIIMIVVVGGCSLVVRDVPDGWLPKGYVVPEARDNEKAENKVVSLHPLQAMKDARFWLLFLLWIAFISGGLMFISNGTDLFAFYGGVDLEFDSAAAALGVSAINFFGMCGRFGWGWVSDHLGREKTFMAIALLGCIMAICITFVDNSYYTFLILGGIFYTCTGGCGSIVGASNVDYFGPKYATENYGIMIIAMTCGAMGGPLLSAVIFDATGSYDIALFVIAGMFVVSFIAAFFLLVIKKNKEKALAATNN